VVRKIIFRFQYFLENEDFGEAVRRYQYDITKVGDQFYANPIELRLTNESVVMGEGDKRIKFDKGDYISVSRGLDGDDYIKIRKFTKEEVQKLISDGTAIECDKSGAVLSEPKRQFSGRPNTPLTPGT